MIVDSLLVHIGEKSKKQGRTNKKQVTLVNNMVFNRLSIFSRNSSRVDTNIEVKLLSFDLSKVNFNQFKYD